MRDLAPAVVTCAWLAVMAGAQEKEGAAADRRDAFVIRGHGGSAK